jgi:monothiol glutaredoxin
MLNGSMMKIFSKLFTKNPRQLYFAKNICGHKSAFHFTSFKFFSAGSDASKPDSEASHSDFQSKTKQDITNENVVKIIDEWVKNNDVVLFMKGNRELPRCGFSNYAVQILNFYGLKNVKVVNILENPLVREEVKKYSNWPTYPQLYVKGSLVGGCDILKEMHENGTLAELLEREGIEHKKSK